VFITNGTGGYPGVATYGTDYDFDATDPGKGEAWVSSKNWLVNDTITSNTDYYALLYKQFGSPTPTTTGNTTLNSQLSGSATPYYYNGALTIDTLSWSVGTGQSVVVFVNGDLLIKKNINITGSGFVAFIVNGDITVNSNVGVAYASSAPVVEGVYVTSPTGTFHTRDSITTPPAGTARFVGKGMFIAGDFDLGRNVGDTGNLTTSSELFIYNPQLLVLMPDKMKQLPISWQEVAP